MPGHRSAQTGRVPSIMAWGASVGLALLWMQAAYANHHNPSKVNYVFEHCTAGNPVTTTQVAGGFKKQSRRYDFLTEWVDISHPTGWNCLRYSNLKDDVTRLDVALEATTGNPRLQPNFAHEGENYSIYAADPQRRVGYILRRRLVINLGGGASSHTWMPMHESNLNTQTHPFEVRHIYLAPYTARVETQVKLLKWAEAGSFPGTDFALDFPAAKFKYLTPPYFRTPSHVKGVPGEYPNPDDPDRPWLESRVHAIVSRSDKTCSTRYSPSPVRLPAVAKAAFTGIGSSTGKTPFTLELMNCDADITSIAYSLEPASGGEPGDGILALSENSTAQGVGIQILDERSTQVAFAPEKIQVQGYRPGDDGANIQMYAQYLQTGKDITAGSVHAAMTVVYTYK